MTDNVPVREIELAAREYLAEIACAVIQERTSANLIHGINTRIRENIRCAESERGKLAEMGLRFAKVRDKIFRKTPGENFLGDVVQKKIDEIELNRLQIQLMIAKMNVALEILANFTFVDEVFEQRDALGHPTITKYLPRGM